VVLDCPNRAPLDAPLLDASRALPRRPSGMSISTKAPTSSTASRGARKFRLPQLDLGHLIDGGGI